MGHRLLTRRSHLGLAAAALAAVAVVGFGPGTAGEAAAAPEAAPAAAPLAPADHGPMPLEPVTPVLIAGQSFATRLVGPLLQDQAR